MPRAKSLLLLAISSLLPLACLRDHCEGAQPIPVQGLPSSYTLTAGEYPDSIYVDGSLIVLVGRGGRKLASGLDGTCAHQAGPVDGGGCPTADWNTFSSEVKEGYPDLPSLGFGLGQACGTAMPAGCVHFFTIRDWGATNAVVQTLLNKIRDWDLGVCIGVIVSGQAVMCPA
jgi:hypothetical protein